tara:strand:- start:15 stop:398 length:384 start_codon:yes stop_codon:yes gene_type:complete
MNKQIINNKIKRGNVMKVKGVWKNTIERVFQNGTWVPKLDSLGNKISTELISLRCAKGNVSDELKAQVISNGLSLERLNKLRTFDPTLKIIENTDYRCIGNNEFKNKDTGEEYVYFTFAPPAQEFEI